MYTHLFAPLQIKEGLRVKNRIFMAPMMTNYATSSGRVTQRLIDYYVERSRGGAGLIFIENTCVHPEGPMLGCMLQASEDSQVDGLRKLAEAVKEAGSKVVLQLSHAGARTPVAVTGKTPMAPSPIAPPNYPTPREMTVKEILSLIDSFAQAAARAREAGFDGIDFHMASGYLISQFLSPHTNHRDDDFGGDWQRRARFAVDVVKKSREYTGRDYPIFCKLNASDYLEGGLEVEEVIPLAQLLAENGVDAITFSGGMYESIWASTLAEHVPPGLHVEKVAKVHKAVTIPVGVVGKINSAALADKILGEGHADFILMGRALIADPHLPKKSVENHLEEIRPCINCLECSVRLFNNAAIACSVNPCAGQEAERRIIPATTSRKVFIIGGGPAGMEAARTAALRGHTVTLFEKSARLGGQLNLAAKAPFKGHLAELISYYERELAKLKVGVRLNETFKGATSQTTDRPGLIMAVGARPMIPEISGLTERNTVTAWELLSREIEVGPRVVVLGGGLVGCDVAEYLSERGKEVTLIEQLKDLNVHPLLKSRKQLMKRLSKVNLLFQARLLRVENSQMYIEADGLLQVLQEPDTFVLALGAAADPTDVRADDFRAVKKIGDCVFPRQIVHAVAEGFQAGLDI